MLSVQTNVSAISAQRNLGRTSNALGTAMERLSSGFRINRAADDAAGLAVSEKLKAQIGGLNQASRNAQDGISMIQTAEGALDAVQTMMQRMRDLSVQASSDTNSSTERDNINLELTQLTQEINSVSVRTKFNGQSLLDGTMGTGTNAGIATLQTGANKLDETQVKFVNTSVDTNTSIVAMKDLSVALSAYSTTASRANASDLIDKLDKALGSISSSRATLGAAQNRLQYTIANLGTTSENLSASNSRIRDVDVATESSNMAKNQVLEQAGVSVLAQANQLPQLALKLLG